MKKLVAVVLAILFSVIFLTGCGNGKGGDGLTVVTSFYVMDDFARKIGGDKANYICLVPAGGEAHHWEPSTKDMVSLERADIFIYSGAGFEHWAEDVLKSLSNKDLTAVEAAKDVTLLESGTGGTRDPHIWLSPLNAKIQLKNIADAFSLADPENEEYYRANYAVYAAECDALHEEYLRELGSFEKREIVVAHKAFGYLANQYNLEQIAIAGISSEEEPSAARMAEIAALVNDRGIKVIFFEELVSPATAMAIAREAGAETAVLSPIEALTEAQAAANADYFAVMRENLAAIKDALTKLNG